MMKLFLHQIASPIGMILLVRDAQNQVRALDLDDHIPHLHRLLREHYGEYELVDADGECDVEAKLQRYFAGQLDALNDVRVATNGTGLQRQVWAALREIPAGTVNGYGELARRLGHTDPRVAKDIGAANAANPIAIIVPCHRVIGRNGELKGYAWGLQRKRWLLEHEGVDAAAPAARRLAGF